MGQRESVQREPVERERILHVSHPFGSVVLRNFGHTLRLQEQMPKMVLGGREPSALLAGVARDAHVAPPAERALVDFRLALTRSSA